MRGWSGHCIMPRRMDCRRRDDLADKMTDAQVAEAEILAEKYKEAYD